MTPEEGANNGIVLGLVPARAKSKGFPRKNLAVLGGRSLVRRAHDLLGELRARHPALVPRLSTDSAEIAAEWPESDRPRDLRPAELAADETPTQAVVDYELDLLSRAGRAFEAVLLFQATTALIAVEDLEAMWQQMAGGAQSIVAVTPLDHPVEWTRRIDGDGKLIDVFEETPHQRQLAPVAYRPIGVFLATTAFIRRHGALYVSGHSVPVIVEAERAIDIDAPRDLELAELRLSAATRTLPGS